MLGGPLYGAIDWRGRLARRYAVLTTLVPLGFLPLLLTPSFGLMIPLSLAAGLSVAPVLTAGNQVVGDVAARGTETEAYTWPTTALVTGVASGNAAAGGLVTHTSIEAALAAAAAAAALAALVAWALWPRLRPAGPT